MSNEPQKPVDKLRIGRVEASIWKNSGENGTYHSVRIERTYKQGDDYVTSSDYTLAHITAVTAVSEWDTQRLIELDRE